MNSEGIYTIVFKKEMTMGSYGYILIFILWQLIHLIVAALEAPMDICLSLRSLLILAMFKLFPHGPAITTVELSRNIEMKNILKTQYQACGYLSSGSSWKKWKHQTASCPTSSLLMARHSVVFLWVMQKAKWKQLNYPLRSLSISNTK